LETFWRLFGDLIVLWASLAQRGSFGGCTFGTDPEARWLQVAAGGCRWLQVAAGGCRWLLVVEPVGCMMKNRSSMAMAMENFNAK